MFKIEKWSLLGFTRFILAGIVGVSHLGIYVPLGILQFVPRLGGLESVMGFLLISGYSIGESYEKSSAGFYSRRAMRIYPIYIASIFLTFIVGPSALTIQFAAILCINLLFLNQALTSVSYVGPAWSLSLEVWHYALTPVFHKLNTAKLKVIILASLISYSLYTCGMTLFHWRWFNAVGYSINFFTLSFAWILGFLLARERKNPRYVLLLIGFVYMFLFGLSSIIQFGYRLKRHDLTTFFSDDLSGFVWRYTPLVLVWLCFCHIFREPNTTVAPSKTLRFLGDISYPFYLIQFPIYELCLRYGFRNPYLIIVAALLASASLYYFLDIYSRNRNQKETHSIVEQKLIETTR